LQEGEVGADGLGAVPDGGVKLDLTGHED
jgi:hypothetical protein